MYKVKYFKPGCKSASEELSGVYPLALAQRLAKNRNIATTYGEWKCIPA